MIPAHDSPVASLTFNSSANLLASASEKVRYIFFALPFFENVLFLPLCIIILRNLAIALSSLSQRMFFLLFTKGFGRS